MTDDLARRAHCLGCDRETNTPNVIGNHRFCNPCTKFFREVMRVASENQKDLLDALDKAGPLFPALLEKK